MLNYNTLITLILCLTAHILGKLRTICMVIYIYIYIAIYILYINYIYNMFAKYLYVKNHGNKSVTVKHTSTTMLINNFKRKIYVKN